MLITVAARSKAWYVIARSNTGIVISNPTQGMDVSVYSVFLCRWRPCDDAPSKESYRLSKIEKLKWNEALYGSLCSKWEQQENNNNTKNVVLGLA
jgi:hypothetical protein